MKKIVLSVATVMVAAAFAPEASALPVFARQTGMACSACHFQHFPLLNPFGRAFKSSGYTMMGAQALLEDEQKKEKTLSIPANLNFGVLASMGYAKNNSTPDTSGSNKNLGNGYWALPGTQETGGDSEASLFVGGRVSEFAGFLTEIVLAPTAAMDSAKMPILFDVGDSKVGFVPFVTNGQGASYGLETLNTGANAVHSMSNTVGPRGYNNTGAFISAISAQQYLGTATSAVGIALVGTSDKGFFNLTKFQQTGITASAPAALGSTYLRLAATFDLGGWDTGVGVQNWSGASLLTQGTPTSGLVVGVPGTMQQTKASAIDGQLQGQIGEMPLGVYVSYATAPASANAIGGVGLANAYNPGSMTRSSFNIAAELGVLPGLATIGAAVRQGKSGVADTSGGNATDNAFYLTATYKLQQNMLARLSYVSNTGSFWSQTNIATPLAGTNTQVLGSKTTMMNMYVLF